MYTGICEKILKVTYAKGLIERNSLCVYPYGAEQLRPDLRKCLSHWEELHEQALVATELPATGPV